jgi:hypothetical protein
MSKPKYYIRKSDGEKFILTDNDQYVNEGFHKQFPGHIPNKYTQDQIERTGEFWKEKGWNRIPFGTVVEWNDSIWIVSNHQPNEDSINLMSFNGSNFSAHPNMTWPDDPAKRVWSIKILANSTKDFVVKQLTKNIL